MVGQSASEPLVLGRIVGLFGVRGWVRVFSETRPRDGILDYSPWLIGQNGNWRQVEVTAGQEHGHGLVAKLDGIDDRDQAAQLIEYEIAIHRDQLPALPEGEYYWWQLEGLRVMNLQDELLGTVERLMETGANDVVVVQGQAEDGTGEERLIPYVPQVVQKVDLKAGTMTVDWGKDF